MPWERKETSSATGKIIFCVVPSCITSPFRMQRMKRFRDLSHLWSRCKAQAGSIHGFAARPLSALRELEVA